MAELNIAAILAGSVAGFAFGALWYSPLLFLKPWMREAGIAPDAHKTNPGKVFGGSSIFTVVSAFALAYLLGPQPNVVQAVIIGALAGTLSGQWLDGHPLPIREPEHYVLADRCRLPCVSSGYRGARAWVMALVPMLHQTGRQQ